MKQLWSFVEQIHVSEMKKNGIFLFLTTILSALTGLLVWYILHFFICNTISWALCFTGYSGYFIGLVGGCLFLCRHRD